jgi:hypothetical protein
MVTGWSFHTEALMRSVSRKSGVWVLAALAVLVWALPAVPAAAQGVTGTVSGTVSDASSQAIAGASVSLINEGTSETRRTNTDQRGGFTFPAVLPGSYTVRVELTGFQTHERRSTTLTTGEQLAIGDIQLKTGQVEETVTVTAEGTTIDTGSYERSALISSRQMELVAVRSRDITAMLKVLPGVTASEAYTEQESLGGSFGSRIPNIGGARESFSTVTVDGLAGNDMGTPAVFSSTLNFDAIDEVKVQMNNYRAESGRTGGASVSIVTKSGTQEFHGSAYGYKRNEKWNANDTFANRTGVERPKYRHTNAGFTLGGPLYIPGAFNEKKDKVFFFYSFERLDTLTPQPLRQVTMPTERERRGDFSQTFDVNGRLIVIRDPVTNAPFPGNVIPQGRINTNGQALLNRFPVPNLSGNRQFNYTFQESLDVPKNNHLLRLDFKPTPNDSIYLRASHWSSDQGGDQGGFAVAAGAANWGFIPMTYAFVDNSLVGHYTRVFGPKVVSEFSAGWRKGSEDHVVAQDAINSATRSAIGFNLGQFFPDANPLGLMPQAQFATVPVNDARFTYDGRFPLFGDDTIFSASNNTTLLWGSHTVKAGAYFERSHNVEGKTATFGGQFFFDRDAQNPLDTGHSYSNALLGVFQQYRESSSRPPTDGFATIGEAYVQDTWKAGRRLTVDYGLRLAYYTHWRQGDEQAAGFALERYDPARAPRLFQPVLVNGQRRARNPVTGEILPAVFIGGYVPNTGDPFNGMVTEGDDSYPDGFQDQAPILFEPRVGFAYDVSGNSKTALRGGFGVFHNLRPQGSFLRNLTQQPPIQLNPRVFYGTMDTLLASGGTLFPSNVRGWQREVHTPVSYNFSLGVQRDIGWGTVVDVAYVGSLQRHLQQSRNINRVAGGAQFLPQNQDPTRPGFALPDDFFRPYPGYGNIVIDSNDGIANYHSAQVAVNRRFSGGFEFGLAYTYSRVKGTANTDGAEVSTYFDPSVRDYDYLNYDQPHVLVFNYTWDLPRATRLWDNAVVRLLFDNWQVSGITTFASGIPREVTFTTVDGANITGGGDTSRISVTGNPNLPRGERTPERFFDTSVFVRPARGDFGNASRLAVRGPGINNWDITFFKNFPIKGRTKLQFRWEMYNALNHPQYLDVDRVARFDAQGNQVNARFGQVITARTPRIMQGSLRFTF